MKKRRLGRTNMEVAPIVFGGNVFGWTADKPTSLRLLDEFFGHGFNAIDTADVYSRWAPGHTGGESETIIGEWLKTKSVAREDAIIVTKVGADTGSGRYNLSKEWILQSVEGSLRRLGTDYIDVYLSHFPDPQTPLEETLAAHEILLKQGKVRAIGASNLDAAQLQESLDIATRTGLPRYDVFQPEYNLHTRSRFEGDLQKICIAEDIGVINYYSLAAGFLSGKFRSLDAVLGTPRERMLRKYADERGLGILEVLDSVSAEVGATQAEVALAWLLVKPGVTAPIASATRSDQLRSLFRSAELSLTPAQVARLDDAGSTVPA